MKLWPWVKKLLVIVVGFPLLLLGLVMIPLPGPGLLIVVGGLFVLSLEFEWARRHLAYTRARLDRVMTGVTERGRRMRSRWKKWRASRRSDQPLP
ncbi:hypothetical protein BH09PSE5_BH09PSE5_19710 [soil metagenome]